MLLAAMTVGELRKELRKAQQEVARILMEIRERKRRRLANLGKTIVGES